VPDQLRAPPPFAAFDVVGLAASLGGPAALATVLGCLPADFPAAVLVILHRASAWGDRTPALLGRRTALPVVPMADGEVLRPGTVFVAPADRRAVVDRGGRIALGRAQRCRADDLFASLARAFEERTIGVVMTGRLDDGAAGAQVIKAHGGRVIAQDRRTSEQFWMPSAAIGTGCVDLVLSLDRIGRAVVGLVMWPGAAELLRAPAPPWARPSV
jgi:two-component system chemotaxis response regulator CheB